MQRLKTQHSKGWAGELGLQMIERGARTVLRRDRQLGPLTVQKPFYPEDGVCHVYLLHPPGGVVGGDSLEIDVGVQKGARALFTTPAATKVYRSAGDASKVTQHLSVATGATLEWLPAETMLFSGSRHRVRTVVDLDMGARYCGWEINLLGRPRSEDRYEQGALDQSTVVNVGGVPVLIERLAWLNQREVLTAKWGLNGATCTATAHFHPADEDLLGRVRACLASAAFPIAATLLDELLVVRALGDDPSAIRRSLAQVWACVRPRIIGCAASPPRIWAT